MTDEIDRPRVLRAIKKCLSNSYDYVQDALDTLDDIGRGSLGAGMAPLVGGYAMKDPRKMYRSAMIYVDSIEKALKPLITRFKDGRVNASHFTDDQASELLTSIIGFDYSMIISRLSQEKGRDSAMIILKELGDKIEKVFKLVVET